MVVYCTVYTNIPFAVEVFLSLYTIIFLVDFILLFHVQGRQDSTTVAEYTVTVYYTKTFKDNTADPHTFIDQVKQVHCLFL